MPVVLTMALLVGGAAVLAMPAQADSQARIVRLSYLSGDVQVDREGVEFERALRNMPVVENMRLWSGPNSRAEVEFEDGSALRLTDDSMVEFVELRLRADAVRLNHVLVEQGTVYFDINRKDAQDFRVTFGNRVAFVPREARFRVHVRQDHASLAVMRGEIAVSGPEGSTIAVRSGHTITLDAADPGRHYMAARISALPFDNWAEQRRKQRDREVQALRAQSAYPTYVAADLYHYGGYFHHPVHGHLWRPYGVAYGWHPYAHGAWVWYPHYGWVWVSAYPWGWAPYRYGTWLYVSSYGWCWRPAFSFGIFWHRTPRFIHAPPRFRAPRAPTTIINTTVIVGVPRDRRWGGGFDRDDRRRRTFTRDDAVARTWRERRQRDGIVNVSTGGSTDGGATTTRDGGGSFAGRRNGRPVAQDDAARTDTATGTRERARWSDRRDNGERPIPRGADRGRSGSGSEAEADGAAETARSGGERGSWRRNPMPRNNGQADTDGDSEARGRWGSRGDARPRPAPESGATGERSWSRPERGAQPDAQSGRGRPAPEGTDAGGRSWSRPERAQPDVQSERSRPAPAADRQTPAPRPEPPSVRPERSQPAPAPRQETPRQETPNVTRGQPAPTASFSRPAERRPMPTPRAEHSAPAPQQRFAPRAERAPAPQRSVAPAAQPRNTFVRPSRESAPAASRSSAAPARNMSAPSGGSGRGAGAPRSSGGASRRGGGEGGRPRGE